MLSLAGRELHLFSSTGRLEPAPAGPAESLTRTAAGRSFQFVNGVWQESVICDLQQKDIRRIAFASSEYWKLANGQPELREILALGTNVRFLVGDRIVEITDRSAGEKKEETRFCRRRKSVLLGATPGKGPHP